MSHEGSITPLDPTDENAAPDLTITEIDVNDSAEFEGEPNEFSEVKTVEDLLQALAGASLMCWENPAGAGEVKADHLAFHLDEANERLQELIHETVLEHLANLLPDLAFSLPIFGPQGERVILVDEDDEEEDNLTQDDMADLAEMELQLDEEQ